jgi:hypothetical protein
MMTAIPLLTALRAAGWLVGFKGGRITLDPPSVPPQVELALILQHRELVALLQTEQAESAGYGGCACSMLNRDLPDGARERLVDSLAGSDPLRVMLAVAEAALAVHGAM